MNNSRNTRFIVGPILIVVALGLLIVNGMKLNTRRAMLVSELRAGDHSAESQVGMRLRVVGFVGKDPVRKTPEQTPDGQVQVNHFNIEEHGKVVNVEFRDALPDTFQAGGPVQIDGEYYAPGKIRADHVYTKCPSKYESGEKGLKSGKYKPGAEKPVSGKPEAGDSYNSPPAPVADREARSTVAGPKPPL